MKKKYISKLTILLVMLTIGHLQLTCDTTAEGFTTSMFVSPMSQQIILNPGEVYEGSLIVSNSNTANSVLRYKLSVGPYNVAKGINSRDSYGDANIEERNNHNLIMDWISYDKERGIIQPNESETIKFKVTVPMDAPAESQYATILVIDEGESNPKENDVNIDEKLQIASIVYANVSGETIKKGIVMENSIPSFLADGPLESTSMVRNEGNVYTDAEYTLQVWPLFSNEEICTNEENPDTSLVLPDTERYHTQSCNLPAVGIFKAKQIVRIFGEESIVEKTVIVCPIWLLFIIIFAIFALIFYFIAKSKARKKASQKANKN